MNIEEIREYCLSKKQVEECCPFGEETLVYKVCDKIFLLMSVDTLPVRFNVKCEPILAIELREKYNAVLPGYHMNKKHWNTIILDESIPKKILLNFIDSSYQLIVNDLPKKKKTSI